LPNNQQSLITEGQPVILKIAITEVKPSSEESNTMRG
jgi:hypothetical protein